MELPFSFPHKILLASKSPRRRALLKELGFNVEIVDPSHGNEDYPGHLMAEEIPLYLAKAKSVEYDKPLKENEILLTADTIVWLNNKVIGKPDSLEDAVSMITELSGNMHEVFTGVCLKSLHKQVAFYDTTRVYFKRLAAWEIESYVAHYKPLDKAGAYGIQEWIGFIGIERIEGSYFNVMGLPIHKVYKELIEF